MQEANQFLDFGRMHRAESRDGPVGETDRQDGERGRRDVRRVGSDGSRRDLSDVEDGFGGMMTFVRAAREKVATKEKSGEETPEADGQSPRQTSEKDGGV